MSDKVKLKIQKLLSLAQCPAATANERTVALQRVAELTAKYGSVR